MEQWTRQHWESKMKSESLAAFYLYTPLCGTCKVASKMLEIVAEMRPELPIGKADLNFVEEIAVEHQIESVPCLLIAENGQIREKIYAFRSVPYLLEKLS